MPFQRRTERREVEIWANRDVKGLFNGYYLGGFKSAKQWMAAEKTTSPKDFGLPDKEEAKFRVHVFETHGPSFAAYMANPLSETGSLLNRRYRRPRQTAPAFPSRARGPTFILFVERSTGPTSARFGMQW